MPKERVFASPGPLNARFSTVPIETAITVFCTLHATLLTLNDATLTNDSGDQGLPWLRSMNETEFPK